MVLGLCHSSVSTVLVCDDEHTLPLCLELFQHLGLVVVLLWQSGDGTLSIQSQYSIVLV
jgi:hypothetical protein